MVAFTIDERDLPLLRIRYPSFIDDRDVDDYLRKLVQILDRAQPIAIFVDLRRGARLTPRQRAAVTDFFEQHEAAVRRHVLGVAAVITSAEVKGVATALSWVRPLPYERQEFQDPRAAETWLLARLAATKQERT